MPILGSSAGSAFRIGLLADRPAAAPSLDGYHYYASDVTIYYECDGTTWVQLTPGFTDQLMFIINGGGAAIATGIVGDLVVPYACTIQKVVMLADQSTTTVVNIWKRAYASFPPTVTQKITASAPPTITSAIKSQDSTLTGWTTSIAADEILRFNVDANDNAELITISLKVTRS